MKIDRTLIWFYDGKDKSKDLLYDYFGLSFLLNSMINDNYDGVKIGLINIHFYNKKSTEFSSTFSENKPRLAKGHALHCYIEYNSDEFLSLSSSQRKTYVWDKVCESLKFAAKKFNNELLFQAVEKAKEEGVKTNYNTNFTSKVKEVLINDVPHTVSIIISFKEDGLYSKCVIINNETKKKLSVDLIREPKRADEYFLVMVRSIVVQKKNLVIKGDRQETRLPIKVPMEDILRLS